MSFVSALKVVGTGLTVFSQLRQSRQQQQIFEYNAAVNRQKATLIQQASALEKQKIQREKIRFRKKQVAAFAGAGVVPSVGSPLEVIADSASNFELEKMIEDYNTRLAVLSASSEAELNLLRSREARTAGFVSAGTTLLSQIPTFTSSFNKGKIT